VVGPEGDSLPLVGGYLACPGFVSGHDLVQPLPVILSAPYHDASNPPDCYLPLTTRLPQAIHFHTPQKQGRSSYVRFSEISGPTRRETIRSRPW